MASGSIAALGEEKQDQNTEQHDVEQWITPIHDVIDVIDQILPPGQLQPLHADVVDNYQGAGNEHPCGQKTHAGYKR